MGVWQCILLQAYLYFIFVFIYLPHDYNNYKEMAKKKCRKKCRGGLKETIELKGRIQ